MFFYYFLQYFNMTIFVPESPIFSNLHFFGLLVLFVCVCVCVPLCLDTYIRTKKRANIHKIIRTYTLSYICTQKQTNKQTNKQKKNKQRACKHFHECGKVKEDRIHIKASLVDLAPRHTCRDERVSSMIETNMQTNAHINACELVK